MPAKRRRRVLDGFALLAFLEREPAADRVRSLLRAARATGEPVVMNEVNVGDVYNVIARRRTLEEAEQFLARLESLPIQVASGFLGTAGRGDSLPSDQAAP